MVITLTSLHLLILISIISLALSYFIFRKWTRSQVGKSADFTYLRNCSSRMYERLSNAEKKQLDSETMQTKVVNGLQNQIAVIRDHVQVKLGQKIDEYASNNAKYYGDVIRSKNEEIEVLKTKLKSANDSIIHYG